MNNLEEKIGRIKQVLDVKGLINQKQDKHQIIDYYRTNRIAYLLFHNRQGYLHMGLSKNGIYSKEDLIQPVLQIEEIIHRDSIKTVMELGCGRGANSYFLAKRNPSLIFKAIDLSTGPLRKYKNLKNLEFYLGDYHFLDMVPDGSVDLFFGIETLCHSDQKEKLFATLFNKLRSGGFLVSFDGYYNPRKDISEVEKEACILVEHGMAVNHFDPLSYFEDRALLAGFNIKHTEDLTTKVIPSLKRFETLSFRFFKRPILAKMMSKILPEMFIRNSISGYLMPDLVERKIAVYYKYLFIKP